MSKTEESWRTKGDKSYYYWHRYVSNKVPTSPPLLVEKKLLVSGEEHCLPWKMISCYSWMDNEKNVKVFVELAKLEIGLSDQLSPGAIRCTFSERGFDLRIELTEVRHRLSISALAEKIDPSRSTYRIETKGGGRVVILLQKADEKRTWWQLTAKQ